MKPNMAVIFALAPVFIVCAVAAWNYHLPIAAALIALGYIGFFIAYARAPSAPARQEPRHGDH